MAEREVILERAEAFVITARRPGVLLEIALWPPVDDAAALAGLALPADGKSASVAGARRLFRLAPRRLWLWDDGPDPQVAEPVPADQASWCDLSHARMVFELAGPRAESLMTRLVPIDLRASVFPVGAFAQSFIQDAGVLIHRTADDAFALFVPTSFSQSIAESLCHAATLLAAHPEGEET